LKTAKRKNNSLDWLLEPENVGVRYLALRDLVPGTPKELTAARLKAHKEGPIAAVLNKMESGGFWVRHGAGYNPKYKGSVWSLILLSQLGASIEIDKRIETACEYYLQQALTEYGQIGYNGQPSGTIDCLQGNLCAALLEMGCKNPLLEKAYEWMARTVTGEGLAPAGESKNPLRYYGYKCGPLFACGANGKLPCAWGGVKVMLAFSKLPEAKKTPLIKKASAAGAEFIFSKDPLKADYPTRTGDKPSRDWWKFGFPVFYVTDLLQNVEAMIGLGFKTDPRLAGALKYIQDQQDDQGRWLLNYDYTGKTWVDFGPKKEPNKWITYRALKVLEGVGDNKE
jgi:hypothetical protein